MNSISVKTQPIPPPVKEAIGSLCKISMVSNAVEVHSSLEIVKLIGCKPASSKVCSVTFPFIESPLNTHKKSSIAPEL